MRMRKKLTSHPRFLTKLKRDLKDAFYDEDYHTFINKFQALQELDFPETELTEMFYESLFNTGQNEAALLFGETYIQMLESNHEDNLMHMLMIVKALKNLGRSDEIAKWIAAIATSPHIENLDSAVLEELEKISTNTVVIEEDTQLKPEFSGDIETALIEGSIDSRMQAIDHLIDTEDETYVELISRLYKTEEIRVIQSMMISYLKQVDYNEEPIVLNKFGESFKKYTSEFKVFEQEAKLEKTIEWIIEIGREKFNGNQERIEQSIEMFINISMLWYPYHVSFPPQKLANMFINYVRVLHNELDAKNFHGELADWIFKIEDEMVKLNQ